MLINIGDTVCHTETGEIGNVTDVFRPYVVVQWNGGGALEPHHTEFLEKIDTHTQRLGVTMTINPAGLGLLDRAIQHAEANPDQYDQTLVGFKTMRADGTACTVHCIAGWMVSMSPEWNIGWVGVSAARARRVGDGAAWGIVAAACEILGITGSTAYAFSLFGSDSRLERIKHYAQLLREESQRHGVV